MRIVFGLGAVMILIYAVWAATPGKSGAPFAWSMTTAAWQSLLCLVLVYLVVIFVWHSTGAMVWHAARAGRRWNCRCDVY